MLLFENSLSHATASGKSMEAALSSKDLANIMSKAWKWCKRPIKRDCDCHNGLIKNRTRSLEAKSATRLSMKRSAIFIRDAAQKQWRSVIPPMPSVQLWTVPEYSCKVRIGGTANAAEKKFGLQREWIQFYQEVHEKLWLWNLFMNEVAGR